MLAMAICWGAVGWCAALFWAQRSFLGGVALVGAVVNALVFGWVAP